MIFTLIICTYKRQKAIQQLLNTVKEQSLYPHEILIIDGSPDLETQTFLEHTTYQNLKYFKVPDHERGLTKQRNYGISRVSKNSEIVCFLDDDTLLDKDYFKNIIQTYQKYPEALGVGGYITNEVVWQKQSLDTKDTNAIFVFDNFTRAEPLRFKIRKKLCLDSNVPPGFSPLFSHGRSVSFLPPSGNVYPVEQLMGGVSSFKTSVFKTLRFSTYFDGYGLYEDADFSIRLAKIGKLYLNTAAQLEHHHDAAGRPNQYAYGKMVVRNGWYVWRVKNPKPKLIHRLKWNAITLVLLVVRASNVLNTSKKKEALTETLGRISGLLSLVYNAPKINS